MEHLEDSQIHPSPPKLEEGSAWAPLSPQSHSISDGPASPEVMDTDSLPKDKPHVMEKKEKAILPDVLTPAEIEAMESVLWQPTENMNLPTHPASSRRRRPPLWKRLCCGKSSSIGTLRSSNSSGSESRLLPPQLEEDAGLKTLVIDLDETLVHSSFNPLSEADWVIAVEFQDQPSHNVYVCQRPYAKEFLEAMSMVFEVIIFTASLSNYADPVIDLLDQEGFSAFRLFREACSIRRDSFVKDLGRLGRSLKDTIIVDNSPTAYMWHPHNAVPVASWYGDPNDAELKSLIPFLLDLAKVDDVRSVLKG